MKKIILAAATASVLIAAPASAQTFGRHDDRGRVEQVQQNRFGSRDFGQRGFTQRDVRFRQGQARRWRQGERFDLDLVAFATRAVQSVEIDGSGRADDPEVVDRRGGASGRDRGFVAFDHRHGAQGFAIGGIGREVDAVAAGVQAMGKAHDVALVEEASYVGVVQVEARGVVSAERRQ